MKHMMKKLLGLSLAALLILSLAACGDKADSPADAGEETSTQVNTLTQDAFADYDLTLVNNFATWCGPCVHEIPYLEILAQEYAEKGVNVIGVVLDVVNPYTGEISDAALEAVAKLREKTEATYPFYAPDYEMFDGRLAGVSAVPETFFVDRDGNIVGETYVGARSYQEWADIVDDEMAALGLGDEE